LPLSVFISNAKLIKYNKWHIETAINEIENLLEKNNTNHRINMRKKELLIKFFREDILDDILFIRKWINDKDDEQIKYFFLTALLSILEDVSYTDIPTPNL